MKQDNSLNVKKQSGEIVPFESDKLIRSLRNTGADEVTIQTVLDNVLSNAHDGITTQEIYRRAFATMKKLSQGPSVRYRLKEALMQLGPTGYPFERFIGDIFTRKGFDTYTGVIEKGYSITHEVDVLAVDRNNVHSVECKYHTNQATKSDAKVAMYVLSRYKDLENAWRTDPRFEKKKVHQWIITNTRFTEDAVKFAEDYRMNPLGWNYPIGKGLREWLTETETFPITCLSSLNRMDKERLIGQDIVTCKTLYDHPEVLDRLRLQPAKKSSILKELENLFESLVLNKEYF